MRKNSSGVDILVNFSMPFFTPPMTMSAVARKNTTSMMTDSQADDAMPEKMPVAASGLPASIFPAIERRRKSRDHPPTTQ